jgi:hypothetical protein
LDVSKGESHAQAFLDRGAPHGKIFRFNHDLEGLASFLNYIRGVESAAGMRPSIVMEATGHYHSPVPANIQSAKTSIFSHYSLPKCLPYSDVNKNSIVADNCPFAKRVRKFSYKSWI